MGQTIEVCTVRDAAMRLRVSQATIRRLIASGRLRAMRVGRSVRIDWRVLDRMLAQGGIR